MGSLQMPLQSDSPDTGREPFFAVGHAKREIGTVCSFEL